MALFCARRASRALKRLWRSRNISTRRPGFRLARASRALRVQAAELFTEVRDQGVDVDVLDRDAQCAVAVLAAPSLGLADADPVGGAVAGALEAGAVDEGLDQMDWMAVLGQPVGREAAGYAREQVRGQMRDANPGEDEEAGVVGSPVQPLGTGSVAPADEAVAAGYFPGGGAEEQTGEVAPVVVASQVGKMLADRASMAEVMVASEVGGEGRVSWVPGMKQFDGDRGEVLQVRDNGLSAETEPEEF